MVPDRLSSSLPVRIFRHKKKALLAFVTILTAGVAGSLLLPRSYYSEAKLFVRLGRESVALDPTATTGQTMGLLDSRETEINSILEVLRSRGLSEKVADRLGPKTICGRDAAEESSGNVVTRTFASLIDLYHGIEPVDERERAVTLLQKQLSISSPKHSTVIEIAYQARSPKLAQRIVANLIELYRQEHTRLNRTPGSLDFFEEQTELLKRQLIEARDRLRTVKNESGLASIDGQRAMLQQQLTTVEGNLLQSETELVSARAKANMLRTALDKMPDRMLTEEVRGVTNVASDDMRKMLYELELKAIDLRAQFTSDHPLVREITRQVTDARAVVDGQDKSRTHSTQAVNPVRQQLVIELNKEESEAGAAAARLASLTSQRSTVLANVKSLNDYELTIAPAQQRVDQLDAAHRSYVEKREQARIDQALAQGRISNVNVAEAATFEARPLGPSTPVRLVLALVMALCGSMGVALVADYRDRSLRSADDVERRLDLPVLLTIPRTTRHRIMSR